MRCDQCGGETLVSDSRLSDKKDGSNYVRRRRVCQNPNCHRRFSTYETVVTPAEISALEKKILTLVARLDREKTRADENANKLKVYKQREYSKKHGQKKKGKYTSEARLQLNRN